MISRRRTDEPCHGKRWHMKKEHYIWIVHTRKNEIRRDDVYNEPEICLHCDKFIQFSAQTYQEVLKNVLNKYNNKHPWHIIIRKVANTCCAY